MLYSSLNKRKDFLMLRRDICISTQNKIFTNYVK